MKYKKITKSDILDASIEVLKREGASALSARSIARALGCSTQPIYCNYKDMAEIRGELARKAYEIYGVYVAEAMSVYPSYKATGMAYVKFAGEEKELFRCIYMQEARGGERERDLAYEQVVRKISESLGVGEHEAESLHRDMSVYAYGLAVMQNLGMGMSESEVSECLTRMYEALSAKCLRGE